MPAIWLMPTWRMIKGPGGLKNSKLFVVLAVCNSLGRWLPGDMMLHSEIDSLTEDDWDITIMGPGMTFPRLATGDGDRDTLVPKPRPTTELLTELLLTKEEAARVLRVSADTVTNLHRVGRLRGVKVDKHVRWRPGDIQRFVADLDDG